MIDTAIHFDDALFSCEVDATAYRNGLDLNHCLPVLAQDIQCRSQASQDVRLVTRVDQADAVWHNRCNVIIVEQVQSLILRERAVEDIVGH